MMTIEGVSVTTLSPTTRPTTSNSSPAVDERVVTTARLIAADAVERAKSGHPGTAIALAPVATLLFQKHLRHDPTDPHWAGRDRFVLSCGHASILLYTQLFLSGYDVTLDDLRAFRTLDSRTPGHPEYGHTAGVETTTGPLGQGLTTAVGMAMAFAHERAVFDPNTARDASPFDRRVWVLVSDGDLQEGISYEAGALAGRFGLDNLTVIYDDNDIQIEGGTALTSAEDTAARFSAQGWHVDRVELAADGDVDIDALDKVLDTPGPAGMPRIVVLKSQIAFPAPNAMGTAGSHGAPLGPAEVAGLRLALGVDDAPFEIASDVLASARTVLDRAQDQRASWEKRQQGWAATHPDRVADYEAYTARTLPENISDLLPTYEPGQSVATRDASGAAIQAIAAAVPGLWGGSADLAEPNRTEIKGGRSFLPEATGLGDLAGRNIHWGVREHAMGAAMNGIALAGGWRVFAGTFLVFSDYQRPAIRLAALMGLPGT
jgi:transketolase